MSLAADPIDDEDHHQLQSFLQDPSQYVHDETLPWPRLDQFAQSPSHPAVDTKHSPQRHTPLPSAIHAFLHNDLRLLDIEQRRHLFLQCFDNPQQLHQLSTAWSSTLSRFVDSFLSTPPEDAHLPPDPSAQTRLQHFRHHLLHTHPTRQLPSLHSTTTHQHTHPPPSADLLAFLRHASTAAEPSPSHDPSSSSSSSSSSKSHQADMHMPSAQIPSYPVIMNPTAAAAANLTNNIPSLRKFNIKVPRASVNKEMRKARALFCKDYPAYAATATLDSLRRKQFTRLDANAHTYLDYTQLVRQHAAQLAKTTFGNTHSRNPTSTASEKLVEHTRHLILSFFRASPDQYDVIFTANATAALKLVGESYPFGQQSKFLMLADNHNSVVGIREFARMRGAQTVHVPVLPPKLRADESLLFHHIETDAPDFPHCGLFAFPAQSNFSGVKHPLQWIDLAQKKRWHVLLDAAAFVPTNPLDLSVWRPDFVPISFYKMFGYPTGVGCLLVRKQVRALLQRPWFGGGTVCAVSVQGDGHVLLSESAAFEDGTIDFLNIPAVGMGLSMLQRVGMQTICERVHLLTSWLLKQLCSLVHSNGCRVVRIYGPEHDESRGGTIAMNFLMPAGTIVDARIVELRASNVGLSLRTGCFCNPGCSEVAFEADVGNLQEVFRKGSLENEGGAVDDHSFWNEHGEELLKHLNIPVGGAVRASLGMVSNFADVFRMVDFARSMRDYVSDEKEQQQLARFSC